MVTKQQLGQKVSNPAEFFDEIDAQLEDGESPTVNLAMDAPPRYVENCVWVVWLSLTCKQLSAWRWRCAWMHLAAPRAIR